uniref:CSON008597 protein n=1 Tax=Culicoides sonorensis TaxID=179676 RepID=A0A336LYV1_CULSO
METTRKNQEVSLIKDKETDLTLEETYKIALKFYKEKFGKAVILSYDDNLRIIALSQQAKYGPASENEETKPLGYLDIVGKARRQAWQALGNMPKDKAKHTFINTLHEICPAFKPYIEAVQHNKRERTDKKISEVFDEKLRLENKNEAEMEKYNEEMQLRKLQDALNEQTFDQFKEHVDKMHPGNPEQQAILLRNLQEEHYRQYLLHMQSEIFDVQTGDENDSMLGDIPIDGQKSTDLINDTSRNQSENAQLSDGRDRSESESEFEEGTVLAPANMWTRPDIKKFKDEVAEGQSGVLRIGHGDIVTVRVPTNSDGVSLFWEFATDNYDIGFGVYFEFGPPESQEVTVRISDSDSEDDYFDDTDGEYTGNDLESGGQPQETTSLTASQRNLSVVVPVYRRDCHLEVYAGSHAYPGHDGPVFRFNKEDDSLETLITTPQKIEDNASSSGATSSSAKKSFFKDVDDDSTISGSGNSKETKTWRMFKDKVAQAVEDYKSNRSVKDEDSDLDDVSESSVKTDNMPNTEDTSTLLGKSLSSLRNKKKAVFSKLSKSKDSSPAKSLQIKLSKADNDALTDLEKPQVDVESGVEVVEDMVFVHSIPPSQNEDTGFESNIITKDPEPLQKIALKSILVKTNSEKSKLLNTLIQIFTKEALLFALLAILLTFILKLSQFWQGVFSTGFVMLLYRNFCDYLNRSVLKPNNMNKLGQISFKKYENSYIPYETLTGGEIEEHRPVKCYRGWMNIIDKYDPETYSVSQTNSIYVKLDGSTLRISYTKSKISKRHLWNESSKRNHFKNLTQQKIFELKGAKVELWPHGLARKRYYSRKYPIRIVLSLDKQGLESEVEKITKLEKNDEETELDFKDCTDDDPEVLYLFGRCDREKEDWFRQFQAASIGDIYDLSDEMQIKSKCSSANSSGPSTPFKETKSDTETKKRNSSDSNIIKDLDVDDFERIERESLTFDSMIQPCAVRTSAEFLQFIKAYVRKNSKLAEIDSWTGFDVTQPLINEVYWINLVIGRFLYGIIHDKSIMDEIHTFFQRKLSAIKLPNFMEEVCIQEINLRSETPPIIHKIYTPYVNERGIWIDADLTYEGLVHATISTKLNLMRLKKQENTDLIDPIAKQYSKSAPVETIYDSDAESDTSSSSDDDTSSTTNDTNTENTSVGSPTSAPANKKRLLRIVNQITTSNLFQSATEIPYIQRAMENMSKNIKLRVELKGLISRVVINLPSPPSDRLWMGFREPPRLVISAKPTIGESLFDWNIVTSAIENKLCEEIYKQMVYPNLIDLIIPLMGQPTYKE